MNHRERVAMALHHERPDRCPFQASFTPEFAARLRRDLGIESAAAHNPHGGGNTYEIERALDEDVLITSVGWANSYYQEESAYTDEWGIDWDLHPYETPFGRGHYTEIARHPLADVAALADYTPPDPTRPSLYADAEAMIRAYHDEYWIVGATVCTIFETAWALRGLEQTLVDMTTDPDLADHLLDMPYRFHLAAARRLVELGVDMIWLGDDVGTQHRLLMSPRMWRRYLKPRMANLIAEIKAINPELVVAYHTDGYAVPIIPELAEIGIDVLNPVQPASMDPAMVRREFGDRLCFWGTIDEQGTLPFGTPEDVANEVRARIETVGYDGGLILAPTHSVQLDTPLANFHAMVDTVVNTPYG